ncbi:phage tail protein [Mucilaginibacter glaciei]|uniref:Uncharacterized protein n=1 Tax=Mucilaginibacter glaciei TaxID=2772109 RepID=A0A926S3H7_9SPHI|nr:hypothetical protein [Mucilaginibacter glaciei]MBD1394254.1 hypothetical protein [Mucilaginibacter glaciei]
MKRLLNLLLFLCLAVAASAQQKPPYVQTQTAQVLSNWSTLSRQYIGIPKGPVPSFPAYVPDSLKVNALFMRTGAIAPGLYRYDGTQWLQVNGGYSKAQIDSIASLKANKVGGNSFSGGFNNFSGGVGADNIYLTSQARTLVPGETATGFTAVIASQNIGPFVGVEIDRATKPTFRFGEAAGGGSFVVQKNIGASVENWINVFKTDSASVTASNGLTQVDGDIKLGGTLNSSTTIDAGIAGGGRSNPLYFTGTGSGGSYTASFENSGPTFSLKTPYVRFATTDNVSPKGSLLEVGLDTWTMRHTNVDGKQFSYTSDGYIVDEISNSGLKYFGNYRSNFTDLSLVDKRYVDSVNTLASTGYAKVNADNAYGNHSASYTATNKLTGLSPYGLLVEKNVSNENYVVLHNTTTGEYLLQTPIGITLQDGASNYVTGMNKGGFNNRNTGAAAATYLNFADAATNVILTFPGKSGLLATTDDVTTAGSAYISKTGGTMTGDLILSSITPTNALSAAPKGYIDNLLTGITWKNAVRVKTTGNITLSGTQTVDGIALIAGNRVLVGSQTVPAQNGIYLVAAGAWTRVSDADESSELEQATVLVTVGTANKNTQWTYIGGSGPVIGTDPIYFGQISGAGTYTNGSYLSLSGNIFDANLTAFDGRYEILANKKSTLTNSATDYPTTSAVTSALGGYVPTSRTITLGYGLTGGGNLSADRTITGDTTSVGGLVGKPNLASQMALKADKATSYTKTQSDGRYEVPLTFANGLSRSANTISTDLSYSHVWTAPQTINRTGLANVTADAYILTNTTPSTASVTAQWTPHIRWTASAWNTGSSTSSSVEFRQGLIAISGSTNFGYLNWSAAIGNGIFSNVMNLDNLGTLRLSSLRSMASDNNATVNLNATGAVLSRNIADANPALITDLVNASSTADIAKFRWQGVDRVSFSKEGYITTAAIPTYSSGTYSTVIRNATGRFEAVDLTAFNATTTTLSSATLNSTYPSAALGFRVICGNITAGGVVYVKYAASTWLATNAPVQP